eukprot:791415_1
MSYEISVLEDKRIIHHKHKHKHKSITTENDIQMCTDVDSQMHNYPNIVGPIPKINWIHLKHMMPHTSINPNERNGKQPNDNKGEEDIHKNNENKTEKKYNGWPFYLPKQIYSSWHKN